MGAMVQPLFEKTHEPFFASIGPTEPVAVPMEAPLLPEALRRVSLALLDAVESRHVVVCPVLVKVEYTVFK